MGSVLERSFSFVFIIFMGYFLKRKGIFHKEDFRVLSLNAVSILVSVTLIVSVLVVLV